MYTFNSNNALFVLKLCTAHIVDLNKPTCHKQQYDNYGIVL